jgi:hypothetical protein
LFAGLGGNAQTPGDLVSGPMLGQADYRAATVWIEAKAGKQPLLRFWGQDNKKENDVTVSPLSSATHVFGPDEKNNPYRVLGIDQLQNHARITISGAVRDRKLNVKFLDLKGNQIGEWTVNEKELR